MKQYFTTTKIAIAFSHAGQHCTLLEYFGKRFIPAKPNGIVSFYVEQIPIKNGLAFESYRYGEISDASAMPDYAIITYNDFLWLVNEHAFWYPDQLTIPNFKPTKE